jgi:hypothetical protein
MIKDIVWSSLLDQLYRVVVTRTEPYQGELTIAVGDSILHAQPVELTHNALLGCEADDVRDWVQLAADFIDGQSPGHPAS